MNYNEDLTAYKIQPKAYIKETTTTSTTRMRELRLKRKLAVYANNPEKVKLAVEYLKLQLKRDVINDQLKAMKLELES